jgi:hypothetical protein
LLPSGKISQQKRQKGKLDGIFIIFESNPKIKKHFNHGDSFTQGVIF